MRPRRLTRNAGGSGGSCDGGVNENGDSSPCQPGGEMDESIVLDAKNLLEMLGASSPVPGEEGSGEEEEEEGDEEEDEKLDLVMALDGRFRSVDLKRKFSESVLQISGGGVLRDETAGSPVASHVARSSSGDGSGSTDSREGRSSSGSGSYSGCVDGSMPEAGITAAPPAPRRIKTVLRVRPLEPSAGRLSLSVVGAKTVMTINPIVKTGAISNIFKYGKVLDETVPQESVFDETAKPLVDDLLQGSGKNGLVMAYGATNAGKTHTIMGARDENDGILPRTLAAVYEGITQGPSSGNPDDIPDGGGREEAGRRNPPRRVNFRVAEVYTNKAYDLLRDEQERGPPLAFKWFNGEDKVEGLSDHYPEDLSAALKLVKKARSRAPISATALNATSSRGHTIWMIEVQRGDGRDKFSAADGRAGGAGGRGGSGFGAAQQRPAPRNPMMWIVDLAGSERTDRSLSKDGETSKINSDITDLFRCFKQVEAGSQHVTFRTRTLTRMLKNVIVRSADSADPRMNCVMVVNVNPAASEYSETQKVLNNALISMKVRTVPEPPRAGLGSNLTMYGLNGHLLRKRPKITGGGIVVSEGMGAEDCVPLCLESVSGKGKDRQLAVVEQSGRRRVGSARRATMSRNEQARVIEEQGRDVARLEAEVAELRKEMEEMQESVWEEAQAEFDPLLVDLEAALAKSRANESDLRLKLDRQDPVGASARAAVAQSARKQAAKQAQTLSTQLTENVQEAEDETRREAEKRACAEKALATALAEKEAGAARAAEELAVRAASEAAVREELARSEDRVVRLEADLARVEAVVVAEKARADELEARNAGLVDQLNAAVEEIGRLQEAVAAEEKAEMDTVQMNVSASSHCLEDFEPYHLASGGANPPVALFSPPKEAGASTGWRKGGRSISSSGSNNSIGAALGGRESGSGDDGGSGGNGEAPPRRTRATRAHPSGSSARSVSFGRGSRGDRVRARASLANSRSVQDGGGCNEGGGGVGGGGRNGDNDDDDNGEGSRSRVSEASVSNPEVVVADGDGDGDGRGRSRENGQPSGEEEVDGEGRREEKEEEEEEGHTEKAGVKMDEKGAERGGVAPSAGDPNAVEQEEGDEGELDRKGGRPKRRGIRSKKLRLRVRKPLGNIQPTDGSASGVQATAAADGKDRKKRMRTGGAGDCGREDEEEEKAVGFKVKRDDDSSESSRSMSRKETRRCKAAREKAMLSKPSPEVVTLTEKQAALVDLSNKLVKTRRSGRRRGHQ